MDSVLVDLGTGAFASGQPYVALSRGRSLEGMRLARAIRPTDIMSDPIVKRFYLALAEMIRQPQQKPLPHVHFEENSQGGVGTYLELCVVEANSLKTTPKVGCCSLRETVTRPCHLCSVARRTD